ncbi:hypothetical protein AB0O31_17720 [Kitasatospora cineracea]|uniref:hypothetical protein n=1 Tax=Kitasatospora cineracea TaxID=88074 RepID=UPI00341D2348
MSKIEGLLPKRLLPERGGAGRNPLLLAGGLAGAWLVPLALCAAHLGLLLLPLLVLAVAGVLRTGGVLLDRLVVALLVVSGSVLAFGLLFSLWPWGIGPVPTCGALFSAVVLTAWTGRRRFALPLRFRSSDLLVVGTGAAIFHYLYNPLSGSSDLARLAFLTTAEDRLGHLSYFDGIQQTGGYNFLHQEAARSFMMSPAEIQYPQGSHFLLAWIDGLARSSAHADSSLATVNRYFLAVLVSYALLGALAVWAARWVGGPRLRGWRTAAVGGTVAAVVMSGSWTDLIIHGFDSTIVGLLFVGLAVALFVRPAMGSGDFLVVSVAALVAVTYTYNLFGVVVGAVLVTTSLVNRRRFAGHRRLLYGLQLVGAGIAWLPSVLSVLQKFDVASTSNLSGPSVGADRQLLVGGLLLALLAGLAPLSRRTAAGRSQLAAAVTTGLVVGAFGAWQLHTIGTYSYYFEKIAACGVTVALISLGAAGTALRGPVRPGPRAAPRRLAVEAAASGLALVIAFNVFAGMQFGLHRYVGGPDAPWKSTALAVWSRGQAWSDVGPRDGASISTDLAGLTGPVVALYSNDDYKNLKSTWLANLLRHRGGDMQALYQVHWVAIGGPMEEGEKYEETYRSSMEHLAGALGKLAEPATVLVADERLADRMRRDLEARGIAATVRGEPQNRWTAPWQRSFPGD